MIKASKNRRASDQTLNCLPRPEIAWNRFHFCFGDNLEDVFSHDLNFETADIGWKTASLPVHVGFVENVVVNYAIVKDASIRERLAHLRAKPARADYPDPFCFNFSLSFLTKHEDLPSETTVIHNI